ncbi:hypothetical protein ACX6XY_04125 [Streptomyces sp. O3]
MQISDSMTYADGGSRADASSQDHPVGEVTLGTSGALGLRSRLLRTSECGAGPEDTFPTGTFPL